VAGKLLLLLLLWGSEVGLQEFGGEAWLIAAVEHGALLLQGKVMLLLLLRWENCCWHSWLLRLLQGTFWLL
jgi:hypothetical protein